MQVKVSVVDGADHTVDIDFGSLTLQDTRAIKKALGVETYRDTFGQGNLQDPDVIAAVIWAKLRGEYPELTIDDIDVPLGDLFGVNEDPPTTGS